MAGAASVHQSDIRGTQGTGRWGRACSGSAVEDSLLTAFEPMVELTCARSNCEGLVRLSRPSFGARLTLVSQLADLAQVLLQNLNSSQLLLLVLYDGLGRNHLLGDSRRDEDKVLLADLDPALLGVELADADAFAHLAELELLGLVARKLDHVKPCDCRAVLAMALENARRAIEQSLEALDEDGPQRPCAEVAGHGLMAVEHALVVAEQGQDVGQGVVVGDERQVGVQVADEVVDLEVVVRLGGLWVWRGCVHVVVRAAPLALEVGRSRLRMAGMGHVEVGEGVGVVAGHCCAQRAAEKNMAVTQRSTGGLRGWRQRQRLAECERQR